MEDNLMSKRLDGKCLVLLYRFRLILSKYGVTRGARFVKLPVSNLGNSPGLRSSTEHMERKENRSCSNKRAAKQEKLQPLERCFSLTSPFIELART